MLNLNKMIKGFGALAIVGATALAVEVSIMGYVDTSVLDYIHFMLISSIAVAGIGVAGLIGCVIYHECRYTENPFFSHAAVDNSARLDPLLVQSAEAVTIVVRWESLNPNSEPEIQEKSKKSRFFCFK